MNRFLICATHLACMMFAGPTDAVALSENGTGQVLLFPYYTVRGGTGIAAYNTLVSIVNTTGDTKAVRLRFREGKNGREVANYNVFLAPLDTWTVALFPSDTGTAAITRDSSCVTSSPASVNGFLQFTNADYTGSRADGEDTSLDRTREGFFEAIEMEAISDPATVSAIAGRNCAAVLGAASAAVGAPTGGLMGGASLVNVGAGTLYSYDPTVLDGFSAVSLYAPVDQSGPTLESVNPKVAAVHESAGIRITHWDTAQGARPADPVSAVLMRQTIINEFVLDAVTRSSTAWVVTMPTKSFYTDGNGVRPFASRFDHGGAPESIVLSGGCGVYTLPTVDREGFATFGQPVFCGVPPAVPIPQLPWAATVAMFNNTSLFASSLTVGFFTPFQNGWAWLRADQSTVTPPAHQLTSTDSPPRTYYGLPMIGFMANDFRNGNLGTASGVVLSNYGQAVPHRGVVRAE